MTTLTLIPEDLNLQKICTMENGDNFKSVEYKDFEHKVTCIKEFDPVFNRWKFSWWQEDYPEKTWPSLEAMRQFVNHERMESYAKTS